jgi:DNA (cytosine-5)-methyltransferase 1
MPKKNSYITITDQFCGAGGSSQGAKKVLDRVGGHIKLALNHWKLAIETHNTNFPDTLHDCTDISASDPRRYPSTDILITSPECTNHTLAQGVKIAKKQMELYDRGELDPAAERSRATMWDVPRFTEYHNYNCIIVENVVDARKWVMFDAWLLAMHALGYNHKSVYINSMHCHPTPQSRDRMYVVFWKKGNKAPRLDYTPAAYCPKCNKSISAVQTWKKPGVQFGKYRQQYVYCCSSCTSVVEPYYYAAFNCIDWSDIGTRIGDRKKSLSPKTIIRCNYGLNKYGKQPMLVLNYSPGYTKPLTESASAITCKDHHGILNPFIINDQHSTGIDFRVKPVQDCIPTIPTTHQLKLLTPFVVKCEHSQNPTNCKPANEPLSTHTTRQSMALISQPLIVMAKGESMARPSIAPISCQTSMINHGVLTPFLTEMHRSGNARSVDKELNTVTAGGVKNGIVTTEAWNSFIASYYNGSHCTKHISEELGSVTTDDRHSLVSYKEPVLEDCYYRMLKPREIKLAMAFGSDYIVLGSGKDQVKQLGNAVTPPAMEWLVERCIESLS